MNFHEKALFVKGDVAAPDRGRAQRLALYPSRYASIHSRGAHTLVGGSVHYVIHLFGLPRRRSMERHVQEALTALRSDVSKGGA
jgi:hypothetical protein